MCMIALRPASKGANIASQTIDIALNRHPDGFGYAARVDGRLVVERFAPAEHKAFRESLLALDATGAEYAAHFRFATSGPKVAEQSHPYVYADPDPAVGMVAVLHNGVISIAHDRAKESDTSAFVRLVLARMPSRWWMNPALVFLVEEAIGWSKLVVMTADETVIVGEDKGKWDGGLWYSSDHKPSAYTVGSNWTPKGATAKPGVINAVVPKGKAPDPNSKRSQRKARRDARHKAAAVTPAVVPVLAPVRGGMIEGTSKVLTHCGHNVSTLQDIDRSKDAEYELAVSCDSCQTVGDVWVVDGDLYLDLPHRQDAPTRSLVPYADALGF